MARTQRSPQAKRATGRDAQTLARGQHEISVSEFFAKNRHLLGFDNPRKALLNTVKEAVDNAIDACEEAGILPELFIAIEPLGETRFRVRIRDNGPGIVRSQVENIFGKLLYGSKFHRLKMSRGQQGIGIAAAGMYGLMTTGKPMVIHTRPRPNKPCHRVVLAIDTQRNKAEVSDEEEHYAFPHRTGTEVQIELEGRYNRGRQSVDEYLELTAIANPHVAIKYQPPTAGGGAEDGDGTDVDYEREANALATSATETRTTDHGVVVFPRTVEELPAEPVEIRPHPTGIELGTLRMMLRTTEHKQLGAFLQNDFSRVSARVAQDLCQQAGMTPRTPVKNVGHAEAERLYQAVQQTRFRAPPTDCLVPIGTKHILAGMLKGVKADFFTATTRPPAVYRGNPFQIEVGLAYGGDLPADELARVTRYANRVPLLYQQSSCAMFKAVVETGWRNYGLSQSKGALPQAPMVIMIHMASVWVPFTSESKESIADYDEIRKEIKLALSDAGRKLKTYLGRQARRRQAGERRNRFDRYINEVVRALRTLQPNIDEEEVRKKFETVAKRRTEMADVTLDEEGNPIREQSDAEAIADDTTVVVDREEGGQPAETQTDATSGSVTSARKTSPKKEGKGKKKQDNGEGALFGSGTE